MRGTDSMGHLLLPKATSRWTRAGRLMKRDQGGRLRAAAAGTTATLLVGLWIAGIAPPAFGVTSCTYNIATQSVAIPIDAGDTAVVVVEGDGTDLDPVAPNGAILLSANGGAWFACGSATIANTMSIFAVGSPSSGETFVLDEFTGARFPEAIAWAVDLGSGVTDVFRINLSEDIDNEVVLTDTTFDLHGASGQLLGAEADFIVGNARDDTIDGSRLTTAVRLFALGRAGDDLIAPGFANVLPLPGDGNNLGAHPRLPVTPGIDGGAGGSDTLDYSARTTTVYIDNPAGQSGHDANGDGDVSDPGDEQDLFVPCSFEILVGGSANDELVGCAGAGGSGGGTFIPGDGDDRITGQSGDLIDWSSSGAAITIDPENGTATGQGTDTWTGVDGFYGSDFDDVLIWDDPTTTLFSGGDGFDTVDASAKTTSQGIDLGALDGGTNDLENLIGGSGGDKLNGNGTRNRIWGNVGNDRLYGKGGNDRLYGNAGRDTLNGERGNDRLVGGPGFDFADGGAGNADVCIAEVAVNCP